MTTSMIINVDGKDIEVNGEKNLLEVIRKAKIDLPTFCYHSELSVYGACRLCMVNVDGRGLQPACSTPPENGMRVVTNNSEIRELRQIIVELLLANEGHECATCGKNGSCQLQLLAKKVGIKKVRFKRTGHKQETDDSTYSLLRNPDKCVLCGDCVRMCSEVQGIGAIDFAFRGAKAAVLPSFGKDLASVECVYCGQCARVCPTGAITPKPEIEEVWKALENKEKIVIAQLAPAVRVALGEEFGLEPGTSTMGQIVSALRLMGFDMVYDTSFAADLTVIEEGNELINRLKEGKNLPLMTSCCPAWVKYAEQYHPDLMDNLSTCKSPQQMFGSLIKEILPEKNKVEKKNIVVVSIMPCTAKKYEARRKEFAKDGIPEVDYILTTQELATMIGEAGIQFKNLEPSSFDMPFGFKTGAGVIFGNSGGVAEAVLRYASEKLTGVRTESYEFKQVRGESGIREAQIEVGGTLLKLAVVSGLKNVKNLIEKVKKGIAKYDIIEIMACPGGCIGGAGQPVYKEGSVRAKRTKGLYDNEKMLQLHKSQENPYIAELYQTVFGGGEKGLHLAHELLHTHYRSHKRIEKESFDIHANKKKTELDITVCFGTSCFLRGAQTVMKNILEHLDKQNIQDRVSVKASFCFEKCNRGPVVNIGGEIIEKCTPEKAISEIDRKLQISVAQS
ncbi:MAG: iron hydrogenase small subunit [Candidatus Brocadiae bacterium]|nr:iron hydrogenase small subunit [Candidatus Brocadiia bacterium]